MRILLINDGKTAWQFIPWNNFTYMYRFIGSKCKYFVLSPEEKDKRISLIKMQKRESFTELYFRITLSSVFTAIFAFVKQIHRAMPIPLLKFSDKDYTHYRFSV